jgi:hypothetical protein
VKAILEGNASRVSLKFNKEDSHHNNTCLFSLNRQGRGFISISVLWASYIVKKSTQQGLPTARTYSSACHPVIVQCTFTMGVFGSFLR